jgi:hypothetical protein
MAFAAEIRAYQVGDDGGHRTELCVAEGILTCS